jgi:hypothetical protein
MSRFHLSNGRATGWRPDTPDPVNDWKLSKKLGSLKRKTPQNPGLNPAFFPQIRDQGQIGSCVAHAVRTCLAYKFIEKNDELLSSKWGKTWDLSPLAGYWLVREIEGTINEDAGSEIRNCMTAARHHGFPTEESWPYIESRFKRKPSAAAFKTGRWHQATPESYRCDEDRNRAKTIDRMLQALDAGMPIAYGSGWFDNFNQADNTGVLPAPKGPMTSGHAYTCLWADTDARLFWGENSWSNQWGGPIPRAMASKLRFSEDKFGYIGMPFSFVLDGICDDIWAVDIE